MSEQEDETRARGTTRHAASTWGRSVLFGSVCVAIGVLAVPNADAGDADRSAMTESSSQTAAPAGMRAYIDPQTGEFAEPPQGAGAGGGGSADALDRASDRLVEAPGTSPGGGVMVDLRGRFLTTFTATVDASGKPAVGCHSAGATAGRE